MSDEKINNKNDKKVIDFEKKKKEKEKDKPKQSSMADLKSNSVGIGFKNYIETDDGPICLKEYEMIEQFKKLESFIKIGGTIYCILNGELKKITTHHHLISYLKLVTKKHVIFLRDKSSDAFTTPIGFFTTLQTLDDDYASIALTPSWPKRADVYYDCEDIEPQDNGALDEFVSLFTPATEFDKVLIKAMICTIAWSDTDGNKPGFLIQSDQTYDGKKINFGKTTLAQEVADIFGGYVALSTKKDLMKTLIAQQDKRVVLYDNVRNFANSAEDLERAITAKTLGAHQLYVGERCFQNDFTYIVTINDPETTTDLASRFVSIWLAKPEVQDNSWKHKVKRFLKQRKKDVLANVAYVLLQDPVERPEATRFPVWEAEVLNKLSNLDFKDLLAERQAAMEFENQKGFEDYLETVLGQYRFKSINPLSAELDVTTLNFWISNDVLINMYRSFSNLKTMGYNPLCKRVKTELDKFVCWIDDTEKDEKPYLNGVRQGRGYFLQSVRSKNNKYHMIREFPQKIQDVEVIVRKS